MIDGRAGPLRSRVEHGRRRPHIVRLAYGPHMAPRSVRSFCHICSPYCGVIVDVDGDRVESVRGDADHPISRGYVCPKGRALGALHHDPMRLDRPQRRDDVLTDVSWDVLLDDLAARISAIIDESGPDAVAMYQGTPALHETIAQPALGKLMYKIGSRSRYSSLTVDIAAKLLVTPMVLGTQLLPVIDIERTELLVVWGTNPVVSHGQYNGISDPITRLRAIAERGELWVIDPRRTETAMHATDHLAIRPGTDHALMAHLVREVLERGVAEDVASRLEGIDELRAAVAPWNGDRVASVTGLERERLDALVDAVTRAGRFSLLTGTGVTMAMSANVTEWLGLALLLLTDSVDRAGGMWCNPGLTFPRGGRPMPPMAPDDGRPGPRSRPDVPRFLAEHPCAALADEIESGNVRALISFGGNPLVAIAEPDRLARAIETLDVFAVVGTMRDQQIDLATHVLPVAGGLERAEVLLSSQSAQLGVVAQYAPAVVAPAADRRPAWWVIGQLARRLGHDVLPGGADVDRTTDDELLATMVGGHEVFERMAAADGPLVGDSPVTDWALDLLPFPPRLAPEALVAQLDALGREAAPDDALRLIPRRRLRRFNSVAASTGRSDHQEVVLHSEVAAAQGIESGDDVIVRSAHGELIGIAVVTDDIARDAVAVSHGYPGVPVGRLTSVSVGVDALSGQITQTGIPVTVEAAGPA